MFHIGLNALEAMDLFRKLHLMSNSVDSSHFENNFERTKNCPVTRNNLNEPSKQRANWRYHCSATYLYSTMAKLSWEILFYR